MFLQPEVVSTLKRTSQIIFDKGGFIRKLENLGTKNLPYKISTHGMPHRIGSYFLITLDVPPTAIEDLDDEYARDVDIVKKTWVKKVEPEKIDCSLQEELLPPAYRKDVQEMLHISKNSKRARKEEKTRVWKPNSGLDYYPFQR